jgi:NAD(P)-dependent dehydrogenase (short-subunit alcohol dehydrogenase family)
MQQLDFVGKRKLEWKDVSAPRLAARSEALVRPFAVATRDLDGLAVAEMEKHGSGHIVQITTSLDENAHARVPAALAALTKGGLNVATRSLAIEYAKRGIRVNAVAPGAVRSSMHPAETYGQLAHLHPVGHMGDVCDVVDAILYVESASLVTGEILLVDGGRSAGH